MMVNGSPLIEIVSPVGIISRPTSSGKPNSSSRTPVPITQTLRAFSSSISLNMRPYWMTCCSMSMALGQVPTVRQALKDFPPCVSIAPPPLGPPLPDNRISGVTSFTSEALFLSA